MPVTLKSSEVQQNFGRVFDQAMLEDDVVIERYGKPRVAILNYQCYQQLVALEQEQAHPYLMPPDTSAVAQEQGQTLAAIVRQEVQASLDASLEEVVSSS